MVDNLLLYHKDDPIVRLMANTSGTLPFSVSPEPLDLEFGDWDTTMIVALSSNSSFKQVLILNQKKNVVNL